jgi:hypothetical protein
MNNSTLNISLILGVFLVFGGDLQAREPGNPFDALFDAIMLREGKIPNRYAGPVDPDGFAPPLWGNSDYLVKSESGHRFREALAAFASSTDAQIADYPALDRAMLQRQLWTVFDWTVHAGKLKTLERSSLEAMQRSLGALIRRLALSAEEIENLPDLVKNTAETGVYPEIANPSALLQPFFPKSLGSKDSPWVCVSGGALRARSHDFEEQWRSAFQIYIRLPGQRKDTLNYLKELDEFREPWTNEKPETSLLNRTRPHGGIHHVDLYVNPDTPQFPNGTQVAMLEQWLLIRDDGELVASPLVASVQVREYTDLQTSKLSFQPTQAVAEFHLRARSVMNGNLALVPLTPEQSYFRTITFSSDPYIMSRKKHDGMGPRIKNCMDCHSGWGIHSVNSRAQLFDSVSLEPPRLLDCPPEDTAYFAIEAKKKDFTWGLLQGVSVGGAICPPSP